MTRLKLCPKRHNWSYHQYIFRYLFKEKYFAPNIESLIISEGNIYLIQEFRQDILDKHPSLLWRNLSLFLRKPRLQMREKN